VTQQKNQDVTVRPPPEQRGCVRGAPHGEVHIFPPASLEGNARGKWQKGRGKMQGKPEVVSGRFRGDWVWVEATGTGFLADDRSAGDGGTGKRETKIKEKKKQVGVGVLGCGFVFVGFCVHSRFGAPWGIGLTELRAPLGGGAPGPWLVCFGFLSW